LERYAGEIVLHLPPSPAASKEPVMKKYTPWILMIIPIYFAIVVCCTPSLHPIYTEEDIIFDPALIGTWSGDASEETWEFAQHDAVDDAYVLICTDEDGDSGNFLTRLVEIGDYMFLDLLPAGEESGDNGVGDISDILMVPMHGFILVDQIEPSLNYRIMDDDWIADFLEQNPGVLKHELETEYYSNEARLLLTASTEDLQAFLIEHIETEGAYGEVEVLYRIEEQSETTEQETLIGKD
jgi:hypothetical protein